MRDSPGHLLSYNKDKAERSEIEKAHRGSSMNVTVNVNMDTSTVDKQKYETKSARQAQDKHKTSTSTEKGQILSLPFAVY